MQIPIAVLEVLVPKYCFMLKQSFFRKLSSFLLIQRFCLISGTQKRFIKFSRCKHSWRKSITLCWHELCSNFEDKEVRATMKANLKNFQKHLDLRHKNLFDTVHISTSFPLYLGNYCISPLFSSSGKFLEWLQKQQVFLREQAIPNFIPFIL